MDELAILAPEQTHLLTLVYDWYHSRHEWPSLAAMGLLLDREQIDIEDILGGIPLDILGRPQYPFNQGQGNLSLTLKGMYLVPLAKPDLDLLAEVLPLCWEAASATPPDSLTAQGDFVVTSEQMRQMLRDHDPPIDDTTLANLGRLLLTYSGVTRGGSYSQEGLPWQVTFDLWQLRKYRRIKGVEDFLRVQEGDSNWGNQRLPGVQTKRLVTTGESASSVSASVVRAVTGESSEGTTPEDGELYPQPVFQHPPLRDARYLFVMMPSQNRQEWSDRVYGWIVDVCRSLVAEYPGLNWHRADELVEEGQITQQIRNEIERAGLLLADLTSNNPNVLYEVGFAHGRGKGVILTNQDLPESPFDLSVHRQIEYSLENGGDFRANVKEWMRHFLGEPDPVPLEPPLPQ